MIRHGTVIPIGEGATSRVYKAFDAARGRWVAIKVLLHPDPATRLRLLRETRAVAALQHPHLCPVLEVDEDDGRPRIVMPFLDGPNLAQCAATLSLEARVRVLAQVADAVHHAHERGLLHRDLKPENIVVTQDEGLPHAWVLDFGLVRELGAPDITASGQVLGTPAFMSPEQARGEATLDRRSDVFALGAVLYFVLCGQPPFAGPSTAETLVRVIQDDPPRPRKMRRDVPAALEAIVLTALEKRPARRYDSVRAFADDLRRYLAGERPLARERVADRVRRGYRRHPLAFASGGALALATLAIIVLGLYWAARSADQARHASELAAAAESARQALRLEYLQPLHDVDPALQRTQATIARLQQPAPTPAQARANLLAIAQLRSDTDDIAGALQAYAQADAIRSDAALDRDYGLALLRAWRAALAEPQPYADPALRARLREHAERTFLQPARERFARRAAVTDDWLAAAQLDDGDVDARVARLQDGIARSPGRYDALLVAAELRLADGVEAHWSNAFEQAEAAFASADALLVAALDIARSDPRLHRRRCELASLRLDAQIQWQPAAEAVQDDACATALRVRPGDAVLHRVQSHRLSAVAKRMRSRGDDTLPTLRAAIDSAERAVALAPDDPRGAQELALALMRWSTQRRWSGQADLAAIERADQVLGDARDRVGDDRAVDFTLLHGQVQGELAKVQEHLGRDPEPAYTRAIASMRTVVERLPQAAFLRLNLANALSSYEYWRAVQGRPDAALVEETIAQLRLVLERDPERATAWSSLADSHWDLAMVRSWRGDDADAAIAEADRLYGEALQRDPENLNIRYNIYGFELFVAAELLRDQQRSNDERINRRLVAAAEQTAFIDAHTEADWITPCPRAEQSLRALQFATRNGRFDHAAHDRARALLAAGIETLPDDHDCARRRVELAAIALRWLEGSAQLATFDDALQAASRHPESMEMALAHLILLETASRIPALADRSDPVEREALFNRIVARTQDAWRARLLHVRRPE